MNIPDGIIDLDTPAAKSFGFTSGKFDGWLWRDGQVIWISFIVSKHPARGDFKRLLIAIGDAGFTIKVPTPSGVMRWVCQRYGFTHAFEMEPDIGEHVEVWTLKPKQNQVLHNV